MNVSVLPVKHSAQGPYLGFGLQPVRMCRHLLTCPPGAQVSLEYLDDVAVHHNDGLIEVEQTKSARAKNPISDWATDLWKTLANWAEALTAGKLIAGKTRFTLYVTPPKTGQLANAMHAASTLQEADNILEAIKGKIGRLKAARECDAHLKAFFSAPLDYQRTIIENFKLIADAHDPVAEIRTLLAPTVDPTLWDDICHYAIGTAKERIDRKLRSNQLPILNADQFKKDFRAFVQKANTPALLTSFTSPPQADAVEAVLHTRPVFIRQLELIEAEDQEFARAVSDFLRTSADKTSWAESGLVFEEMLTEWDDFLIARHVSIAGEVSDLHGGKDLAIRGRLIYRQCAKIEANLDTRSVPNHFVHGSFNDLADGMKLGWHPDYLALLAEKTGG